MHLLPITCAVSRTLFITPPQVRLVHWLAIGLHVLYRNHYNLTLCAYVTPVGGKTYITSVYKYFISNKICVCVQHQIFKIIIPFVLGTPPQYKIYKPNSKHLWVT